MFFNPRRNRACAGKVTGIFETVTKDNAAWLEANEALQAAAMGMAPQQDTTIPS